MSWRTFLNPKPKIRAAWILMLASMAGVPLASAQPAGVLPEMPSLEAVAAGVPVPPPVRPPAPWAFELSVKFEPLLSLEELATGVGVTLQVEAMPTEITRLRMVPHFGGPPITVSARFPFDVDGMSGLLRAPSDGRVTLKITQDNTSFQQRIHVTTGGGAFHLVHAEGSVPVLMNVDGIELVQGSSGSAHERPSWGWNYAVPVSVRFSGLLTPLWQGQWVSLPRPGTGRTVVAVASSTFARPRGEARHLMEGEPFGLAVLVLRVP